MPRRRLNYEMLLRIRQRQEDMRAMALAASRRQAQLAQEQRERISEEQRRTLQGAGTAARERFDASEVRLYYRYERHLAHLGVESDAQMRAAQRQVEERREELIQASIKKRIVERLKERQDETLRDEFRKFEQDAANEVAVNYSALRRSGDGQ